MYVGSREDSLSDVEKVANIFIKMLPGVVGSKPGIL
jgi:hypothetical protein